MRRDPRISPHSLDLDVLDLVIWYNEFTICRGVLDLAVLVILLGLGDGVMQIKGTMQPACIQRAGLDPSNRTYLPSPSAGPHLTYLILLGFDIICLDLKLLS